MKTTLRHLLWIGVLLCSNAHAQVGGSTYTVKPGDSFAKIARNTGCSPAELANLNDLKLTAVIHPGQKLKLPGKTVAQTADAPDGSHTIQAGDTLTSISRRYGVSVDSLLAANPGVNPKTLRPGQKVRFAASRQQEKASAPTATPPSSVPSPARPTATETADGQDPAQETEVAQAIGQVQTVMVDTVMTYAEFAAKHGTDISRLNDLNGLDLAASTVLAKGSELYVPGQP